MERIRLKALIFFKSQNKCVELDTSQDRLAVYGLVVQSLSEFTDKDAAARALTERAEILLGLRPWPREGT